MHPAAVHFAGGDAFFSGTALILIAGFLRFRAKSPKSVRALHLTAVVGALFVLLSATPLPLWLYALWGSLFCGFLIFASLKESPQRLRFRTTLQILTLLGSVAAVAMEVPYRFPDRTGEVKFSALFVIGDSVSAGSLGPEEQTWPKKFRDKYGVRVVDVSHVGAKAQSALKQAEQLPQTRGLVLIEIGGNDLLGGTTARQFETDLNTLLSTLKHLRRRLVMLELPLPPFRNAYGRIQRKLAAQYDVILIPKRHFMSVLAGSESTLDTVHLSEEGHELMAGMIWRQIGHLLTTQNDTDVLIAPNSLTDKEF